MISMDKAREHLTELRDTLLDVGYEVDLENHSTHGVVIKVLLARSDEVKMTVWCERYNGRSVFRFGNPLATPPLGPVDDLDTVVAVVKDVFGSPTRGP